MKWQLKSPKMNQFYIVQSSYFETKLYIEVKVVFSCFSIQGYECAYRMYQPIQQFFAIKDPIDQR